MPEIRHYKVTQTREVNIVAHNEIDAALIAQSAFDDAARGPADIWGRVDGEIRNIELNVRHKKLGEL